MSRGWRPSDDGSADGIRDALVRVEEALTNIGQWAAGHHDGGFRQAIEQGLIVQGKVDEASARTIALRMDALLRELATGAAGCSADAQTLADLIEGEYLEPIHMQRRLRPGPVAGGLSMS